MRYRGQLLGLVLLTSLLVACSGSGGATSGSGSAAAGGPNVTVKGLDTMKFDPNTLTVQSGSPVHLTLQNDGALVHDWVVDSLDGKKVAVEAAPKASASVDFTPTAAGSHEFYCSQPGHKDAGMKGTLTVR